MQDKTLLLKFDLYGELPQYQNINLKPALFESIIENSSKLEIPHERFSIKVPNSVDDCLLRYIEYHEYYAERPDKIKHIEYIYEQIEKTPSIKAQFLEKLHHYTKLPTVRKSLQSKAKQSKWKFFKSS